MKKSVCTLFLFLFVCFALVGCSSNGVDAQIYQQNAFRILRQTNLDDSIALSYIFPVNTAKMEELGLSDIDTKTYRFYLSTYVNSLATSNREKNVEGVTVSNPVYYTDVDGVGFSIVFENLDAQKRFFDVKEDDEENIPEQTSSGFFMKKVELKTAFPVSSAESAKQLQLVCEMALSTWGNQNSIAKDKISSLQEKLQDAVFIYDTASADNSLKSEVMYEGNNLYHNVFIKTKQDLENDNKITFYVTYPNSGMWYLFALVLTCIGMTITYFILSRRKSIKA